MRIIFLILPIMAFLSCNRPTTPPPVTPAQPPTVEATPTRAPEVH